MIQTIKHSQLDFHRLLDLLLDVVWASSEVICGYWSDFNAFVQFILLRFAAIMLLQFISGFVPILRISFFIFQPIFIHSRFDVPLLLHTICKNITLHMMISQLNWNAWENNVLSLFLISFYSFLNSFAQLKFIEEQKVTISSLHSYKSHAFNYFFAFHTFSLLQFTSVFNFGLFHFC